MNEVRTVWLRRMEQIARPVLTHMAAGTLQQEMPLYGSDLAGKERCTYLEALGRTLCGISPWLELEELTGEEAALQAEFRTLAKQALVRAVRPGDPARFNFETDYQPIVDAAFLAEAILRAPTALWESLSEQERGWVLEAMAHTRTRKPYPSNWLLFSAMIEALCHKAGVFWDPMRVDYALRQLEQWYLGDGVYGDGAHYAWDYYNSFVIHPMIVDLAKEFAGELPDWDEFFPPMVKRARRYADHLERMIMPDGTYPVIGRSIAYRFGVFHALAQSALRHDLPETLTPAGVRCALTTVLNKVFEAPDCFDDRGWLQVGVYGRQPGLGEGYISTGSLYLCCVGFLPLGLSPEDPFWSDPAEPFTQQRIWSGEDLPCDHAEH